MDIVDLLFGSRMKILIKGAIKSPGAFKHFSCLIPGRSRCYRRLLLRYRHTYRKCVADLEKLRVGSIFVHIKKRPSPYCIKQKKVTIMRETRRPKTYRPDKDGTHKLPYLRNRKILYATQTHCAICGRPVNFDLKFPDPMSPTADHIVPVSKGGHPSALENLQLAHLGCNQRKSQKLIQAREPIKKSNRSLQLSADWRTS